MIVIRNSGEASVSVSAKNGDLSVFPVGLAVTSLSSEDIESMEIEQLEVLTIASLKSKSVAAFKTLVSGIVTVECAKYLLSQDLKLGQKALVEGLISGTSV